MAPVFTHIASARVFQWFPCFFWCSLTSSKSSLLHIPFDPCSNKVWARLYTPQCGLQGKECVISFQQPLICGCDLQFITMLIPWSPKTWASTYPNTAFLISSSSSFVNRLPLTKINLVTFLLLLSIWFGVIVVFCSLWIFPLLLLLLLRIFHRVQDASFGLWIHSLILLCIFRSFLVVSCSFWIYIWLLLLPFLLFRAQVVIFKLWFLLVGLFFSS